MEEVKLCDRTCCESEGLYRAPRSREALRDYYWFCLEHVKEYNRNWNYFAGMSDAEVVSSLRASVRRADDVETLYRVGGLHADLRVEEWRGEGGHPSESFFGHILGVEAVRWLDVLGVRRSDVADLMGEGGLKWDEDRVAFRGRLRDFVRGRYKELAKEHHPDLRRGDRGSEEVFKRINEAYSCLRGLLV